MRKLSSACFCLLGALVAGESSMAQNRMSDVPPAFFGAQRGKVVAHPNGGFRMHYGRGLTPQGAAVITTGITTIGPLIPTIIGAVAVPMAPPGNMPAQTPMAQAASTGPAPAAAPGCEPESSLPPDCALDSLASAEEHDKHMKHLADMLARLKPVVEKNGGTFEPGAPAPQESGKGTDLPIKSVKPVPGGRIIPPAASTARNAKSASPQEPTPRCPPTVAEPNSSTPPAPSGEPAPTAEPVSAGEPIAAVEPSPTAPPAPTVESTGPTAPNGAGTNRRLWTLQVQLQFEEGR